MLINLRDVGLNGYKWVGSRGEAERWDSELLLI